MRRRGFLQNSALAAFSLWIEPGRAVRSRPRFATGPFTLGVASGDPTEQSVVLWTRLATRPMEPDGGMPPEPMRVRWQLAEDGLAAATGRACIAEPRPQSTRPALRADRPRLVPTSDPREAVDDADENPQLHYIARSRSGGARTIRRRRRQARSGVRIVAEVWNQSFDRTQSGHLS